MSEQTRERALDELARALASGRTSRGVRAAPTERWGKRSRVEEAINV